MADPTIKDPRTGQPPAQGPGAQGRLAATAAVRRGGLVELSLEGAAEDERLKAVINAVEGRQLNDAARMCVQFVKDIRQRWLSQRREKISPEEQDQLNSDFDVLLYAARFFASLAQSAANPAQQYENASKIYQTILEVFRAQYGATDFVALLSDPASRIPSVFHEDSEQSPNLFIEAARVLASAGRNQEALEFWNLGLQWELGSMHAQGMYGSSASTDKKDIKNRLAGLYAERGDFAHILAERGMLTREQAHAIQDEFVEYSTVSHSDAACPETGFTKARDALERWGRLEDAATMNERGLLSRLNEARDSKKQDQIMEIRERISNLTSWARLHGNTDHVSDEIDNLYALARLCEGQGQVMRGLSYKKAAHELTMLYFPDLADHNDEMRAISELRAREQTAQALDLIRKALDSLSLMLAQAVSPKTPKQE